MMQATDGVSGINSQTSGTVTAIARSTLGGGAVQDGDATQILTQWNFRFVIQEGVREGQTITGVNIHCSQDFSPTSMISAPDDNNDQDDGVAVVRLSCGRTVDNISVQGSHFSLGSLLAMNQYVSHVHDGIVFHDMVLH